MRCASSWNGLFLWVYVLIIAAGSFESFLILRNCLFARRSQEQTEFGSGFNSLF